MQFSLDTVRAVTKLLHESDLAEISLETTGPNAATSHLTVRRQPPAPARRRPAAGEAVDSRGNSTGGNGASTTSGASGDDQNGTSNEQDEAGVTVSATAVGMFRSAHPRVKVGDQVKLGQVVGIVESLKIPNEVIAPLSGEISEVMAAEGQAVEYGQPLLVIIP